MFHASVNVADNVFGADFPVRRAFHVLDRRFGDMQPLKLLLRYGVGNVAHVAFDFFLAERRTRHGSPGYSPTNSIAARAFAGALQRTD
jgi:hypothetical protein